ncbi:MAG: hypothetical protein H0Z35_03365 [Thermoanaerobacteraceae bacterium]|nr:hypothetical protein [Thermoanaerobacteraceae bacterium]
MLVRSLLIAVSTFILAIIASFTSQVILKNITSLILAFIILAVIILVGIIFDIIGVAATVASETPFHAKAAKKISGSRQSLYIIKNADAVASFANDVIGDISGTLSGAVGAVIVLRLVAGQPSSVQVAAGTVMTALIAAIIVGGKAFGKFVAINKAEEIIFQVGRLLAWWEQIFKVEFFANGKRR